MQDQTIGAFLEQLGARVPAPGGGAAAALCAAQGAALLEMVARYSTGARYAENADLIASIIEQAEAARVEALRLAQEDARAFGVVSESYKMPKGTEEEKRLRAEAISEASVEAAEPPAGVIILVDKLLRPAKQLLEVGNRSVITDVAAAAETMRAAAAMARVNIEVNMGMVADQGESVRLLSSITRVDAILRAAEAITEAVRKEIAQ